MIRQIFSQIDLQLAVPQIEINNHSRRNDNGGQEKEPKNKSRVIIHALFLLPRSTQYLIQ
jgi:hypothetical protein